MTPLARDEATADALIACAPQMDGEEWAVKALPVLARIVGQARAADTLREALTILREDLGPIIRLGHTDRDSVRNADAALAGADVTAYCVCGNPMGPDCACPPAGAGVTDTRLSERAAEKTEAEQALCIVADAYVWNPTEETMEALREARGAWQSAVGMWKLAARRAGVTDNERTAKELHHIAAIKDTAGVRVWIDGQQSGEPAGERTADSSAGEVVARTAPADAPEEAVTLSGPSGLDASSAPAERTVGTGPTVAEHAEIAERARRGLRAAREFLNTLPLDDGASRRAIDREFIGINLVPDGLKAVDELAALVALADQYREALVDARGVISSPSYPVRSEPPEDAYDTPMMSKALRAIDAVLAGGAGDE